MYRLVSDCGWGDKSWLERFLTAEQAIAEFNNRLRYEAVKTIEEALDFDHIIYSVEEDHEDDEEDWDWMDS